MGIHLRKDLERLRELVIPMGTKVEENLNRALQALKRNDEQLTKEISSCEHQIDHLKIEIKEECLKILALHQPVAKDLRFVISMLKINDDLERMGDMAVHVIERMEFVDRDLAKNHIPQLLDCGQKVGKMVRYSLNSLIDLDEALARKVRTMDDEIDTFNENFYQNTKLLIQKDPEHLDTWLNLIFISKQFERMGDHTTNIVRDVLYLLTGEIVRHLVD